MSQLVAVDLVICRIGCLCHGDYMRIHQRDESMVIEKSGDSES